MMNMHPVVGQLSLVVTGDLALGAEVQAEVDGMWAEATADRPQLFDGPVLTVTALSPGSLELARTSYRYVLAARRSPEIKEKLGLRPLAVSGVLSCPDGVVLGRRGSRVTHGAGFWEFVPSGGVEAPRDRSVPDIEGQILRELWEEIGLGAHQVVVGGPVGLLEDTDSGVVDIVMPISTALSAAEIIYTHKTSGSDEYSEVIVSNSPLDDVGGANMLPESRVIMELTCLPKAPPA